MCDHDIGHMAIHCPVLEPCWFEVRNSEERPSRPINIPDKDGTISVPG